MRILLFLLQKEFKQIFRNRVILGMILVLPIIQLLVLPQAANYEVRNIALSIVDNDRTEASRRLVQKITASGYFKLDGYEDSYEHAQARIETDEVDIVLEIPQGFDRNLVRTNTATLLLAVNAINGTKAGLGTSYLSSIILEYNSGIRAQWATPPKFSDVAVVDIQTSNWFNPNMKYDMFMVPGILALLVTMVVTYLTALNIVKEKEVGTIEQINVTPIKKYQFILGKLIPFWILGLVVLTIGLLVSRLVYGIVPVGNIALIYLFVGVYLLCVLGLGLLISTFADTQQQAMFVAFFFMMIFIMLGGLFTSIDGMPDWAETVTRANPVRYFIDVMRMIVIKGSGFSDIRNHLLIVGGIAVVLNTWAIVNYRKTT
ncbi:MAG: ABC transporter permease [bacterium]|nr:ABC transporter permease [bacterium]